MVFYSTKSREKVFHLPHCKISRRILKKNRQQFVTPEIARNAGYRICACCSPVGMKLRKEQDTVDRFCLEHGISCYLEDGQLHVHTPWSRWRIIANGKENKLFLYHKNTNRRREKTPSIVPGYHSQAIRHTTILGYLDYIVQHDAFRQKEADKEKRKATSKRDLRRNTQKYRKGTANKSFSANQLYSLLDDLIL